MATIPLLLHNLLIKTGKTVAVAESCTGGLLSMMLTSRSGSSSYFTLGIVTYSNRSKSQLLVISPHLLLKSGAVSDIVCRKMASSVKNLAKTDFGIGITGIAGPSGAVAGKPVGTVFIAVSTARRTVCRRFLFKGSRSTIRAISCQAALAMVMHELRRK
jgi:nicotinamide-nucleotide amidase